MSVGRRVSLTGKNKHEKQVQKLILLWTVKIDERHVPTKKHTRKCNGFSFCIFFTWCLEKLLTFLLILRYTPSCLALYYITKYNMYIRMNIIISYLQSVKLLQCKKNLATYLCKSLLLMNSLTKIHAISLLNVNIIT